MDTSCQGVWVGHMSGYFYVVFISYKNIFSIHNQIFPNFSEEPLNGEHLHRAIMRRDLELISKIVESGWVYHWCKIITELNECKVIYFPADILLLQERNDSLNHVIDTAKNY